MSDVEAGGSTVFLDAETIIPTKKVNYTVQKSWCQWRLHFRSL